MMNKIKLFIGASLICVIGVLLHRYYFHPPLSPDSWSYFELSKTVFSDFYHFSTFRSYNSSSLYSASFPPLWPILLASFNEIFNQGPRAGTIINIILLPIIAVSLEKLTFYILRLRYFGLISFFICLSDAPFMDEVLAGRAIALQIAFLLNLFLVLLGLNKRTELSAFVVSGILLGFCLLNRFDATAIVPVVFGFIIFIKPCAKKFFAFILAFLLSVSPWIIYSRLHFGSIWQTDNGLVATAVHKARVTDWYAVPIPTLKADFGGWLYRVFTNIYPVSSANWQSLWRLNIGFGLVCISALFILIAEVLFRNKCEEVKLEHEGVWPLTKFIFLFGLISFFSFVPNFLTGYSDPRYFVFQRMILVALGLGGVVIWFQRVLFSRQINPSKLLMFCAPLLLFLAYSKLPEVSSSGESDTLYPKWVKEIQSCIEAHDEFKSILFIDKYSPSYSPFHFGAVTGLRTACSPENFKELSVEERRLFLKRFDVSHVFSEKGLSALSEEVGLTFEKSECSNMLYFISSGEYEG